MEFEFVTSLANTNGIIYPDDKWQIERCERGEKMSVIESECSEQKKPSV